MNNKPIKKITRFTLILTAALGVAAITTTKPSHASNTTMVKTQRVHPSNVTNSNLIKSNPNQNQKPTKTNPQVGSYDLIHGHHFKITQGKAAVAMDGRTGQITYVYHPNQKRLVASTAKLMTLYLVDKKLSRHPRAWHQRIRISHPLVRMGNNPEFDAFHFKANKKYRIGDLYKATFIASDDNAAVALGEWVGGNNRNFIKMMNKQAHQWHLRARFTSASGLENDDLAPYGLWVKGGYHSGNLISAKSLATIAFYLINKFPKITMKYSRIKHMRVDGNELVNENHILPGTAWYQKKLHTDGLKTGYTPRAGLCLVGTGKRPGKDRLITVVLDDSGEFGETDRLMNFVYKYSNLYNK